MKQEGKQLLLVDLCGRLPYGLMITDGLHTIKLNVRIDTAPATLAQFIHSEGLRYYLRPMSSMTEEEKVKYCELQDEILCSSGRLVTDCVSDMVDWLNKNMFDYRGLIPMGLALEATKGMYGKEAEK